MLRLLFVTLLATCLVSAFNPRTQTPDNTFLTRQKNVYELFWHVDQPTVYHPELYEKATTFNLADNVDKFNDKTAVHELMDMLKHGMLPRGHVFSIMNPDVHHEAVTLFRVFYSAKDFETFYNVATWARFYMNEQMYVYSLCVAVLQRPDTKHFKLPPLYEVMPHFFYNDEVMQQAYQIAMGDIGSKKVVGGVDQHVIMANYTGFYLPRNNVPEHKLNYFLEDVGLNAYYFLVNHDFPYFMKSKDLHLPDTVRGELYLYSHQQLLVRYFLERLSNNMGMIDYVDIDKPMTKGFYPTMHYHNGLPMPHREVDAVVPLEMHEQVQNLKDIHTRIVTAIDLGYVIDSHGKHVDIYTPQGLNILGNVIQGNADTVNRVFYGQMDIVARNILGFGFEGNEKYQMVPGALEIFCTSIRDPMLFSMYKNIVAYFHKYKQNMPKYTKQDLTFSGVKVESMVVDKLLTFFEQFDAMINNAVDVRSHKEAQTTIIKARQYRLNHKPFTYHITVNSEKNTKAMVRMFLGPKYDVHGHEFDLSKNYMNFLEVDEWVVDLKAGTNKIERSSHESVFVMSDEMPSQVFYKKLQDSIDGVEKMTFSVQPYGFPERLLLPKGKSEGMPFKLFVMITEFDESKSVSMESPVWGPSVSDGRPMGFPLDRPIHEEDLNVPNAFFKDVMIYHKQMEELNITV